MGTAERRAQLRDFCEVLSLGALRYFAAGIRGHALRVRHEYPGYMHDRAVVTEVLRRRETSPLLQAGKFIT